MDNMAYLQQIANVDNAGQQAKKDDSFLSKIFNIWTFLGLALFVSVLLIVMMVVAQLSKTDTKDQDLMTQSYWTAYYLNEETIGTYQKRIKNTDLRNMSASLASVLTEIMNNEKSIMMTMTETDIGRLKAKENGIVATAQKENSELNKVLEDARLNGILDRTYLREMTMQIAYLISYQSEIIARTQDASAKAFSEKAKANLENLYERFHDFSTRSI